MLKLNDAMTEEITRAHSRPLSHRRKPLGTSPGKRKSSTVAPRTREIHTFSRTGSSFRTMRHRDRGGINVLQETFQTSKRTRKTMNKDSTLSRLVVLVGVMLALALAASMPALAQTEPLPPDPRAGQEAEQKAGPQPEQQESQQTESEAEPKADPETEPETESQPGEVSAMGRIGQLADYPGATHGINDESTGAFYALRSDSVDLDAYAGEGQRVTVRGVPVSPGSPNPVINVTEVVPADGGSNNEEKATLSFELTVDGDPPTGTAFYGHVHTGEGGPGRYVPLTDPDGDRVYTGTTTVDRFGPGPRPVPPGVEPVSLPVRIVQGTAGGAYRPIKDFGKVKLDGDKTFSASVSFDGEEPVGEEVSATGRIVEIADYPGASHAIADEASGDRYLLTSDSVDLQDYAASGERVIVYGTPVPNRYAADTILNVTWVEPADGTPPPDGGGFSDDGGSGSDSGSDDSGSGGSGGGSSGSAGGGMRGLLPSTGGGMALTLLGAGVLLLGGGLLVRRLAR